MSPVTVLSSVPLADRIRIARETDGVLIFNGRSLEELHQLILDARDVDRAFRERSAAIDEVRAALELETRVAIAAARAEIEREASITRRWMIAAYLVAAISLALRSGGLIP